MTVKIWIASKQQVPRGALRAQMTYMTPASILETPTAFKGLNVIDDETTDAVVVYDWERRPEFTTPISHPGDTLLSRSITSLKAKAVLAHRTWPKTWLGNGGLVAGYNMPMIRTYASYKDYDRLNSPILDVLDEYEIACPCCYTIENDPLDGIMNGVGWAMDKHPRVVPIVSPNTDPDHHTRSPLWPSLLKRLRAIGITELYIWDATGLKQGCQNDLPALVQEIKEVWA